jgi:AAA+ ATPase superfamily predicted ATPase
MGMAMIKPAEIFDRDFEWSALDRFIADEQPGATLGVVSGRRRQGKTYLLEAVCEAAGGFYFGATEATSTESLARLSAALTEYAAPPAPFHFATWAEAVDALFGLGASQPVPVVIDEFPYLVKANPELPSIIQQALRPFGPARTATRTRLLLCGSALTVMGKLLSGTAPLRGRAGLELVVPPLDHRLAAQFWGITDPRLAVKVNAIVGGTPAYRREFIRNDAPSGPGDFDAWVIRTVLNPETPLFREGRYLLAEEPDLRDTAIYHSVLAAIADGNGTRGGIAAYVGRKDADIAHPVNVLEDAGLVIREADAFRDRRSTYQIAEPLIAFYHAIMRPAWSQLERPGSAARVWQASGESFSRKILGPRFEQICRSWALSYADPARLGGLPARVETGVVNDPAGRSAHQLDLVITGIADGGKPPLLAIGEAKWGEVMGTVHLERLRHIRSLLAASGREGADQAKLMCLSAAGFTDRLTDEAKADGDLLLIDAGDLYGAGYLAGGEYSYSVLAAGRRRHWACERVRRAAGIGAGRGRRGCGDGDRCRAGGFVRASRVWCRRHARSRGHRGGRAVRDVARAGWQRASGAGAAAPRVADCQRAA